MIAFDGVDRKLNVVQTHFTCASADAKASGGVLRIERLAVEYHAGFI